MAHWLYVWELGGGLGHLNRMMSVSLGLELAGERVSWCVPQQYVESARDMWPHVIANPEVHRSRPSVKSPATLAELLQNLGWHKLDRTAAAVSHWQDAFRSTEASRLILDFAPTALLSAVACERVTDVVGTGFYIPPPGHPLPAFRDDHGVYPERLEWAEQQIISVIATLLGRPIDGLAEIFHYECVRNYLVTCPEWDHYRSRSGAEYFGLVTRNCEHHANWPESDRHRIFAYLRSFPGLPLVLEAMHSCGATVLVYGNRDVGETVKRMGLERITYCSRPVDERSLAHGGGVMINHAGHDGSIKAVLAGLPLVNLPLTSEQALTAHNARILGVGEWAHVDDPGAFYRTLQRVLEQKDGMRQSAIRWSETQTTVDNNLDRLVGQLLT